MVDHLPLGDEDQRPPPRHATLALLVGRVTTIKLAYWALLTAFELGLPFALTREFSDRFAVSVIFAAAASVAALAWANRSARAPDDRVGTVTRSIPTVATTFAAATVVASPASLPLLLVERQRSIEECANHITCHPEALVLWAFALAIGFLVIPAVFAASLRPARE